MLTIFSFLITIIGTINWLMIGLLQYDFIAGIFGYQASIFSRIIYIVFGLSGVILTFKMIKGKGIIAVFSRRNKKDLKKNIDKINNSQLANANVEASRENYQLQNHTQHRLPSESLQFSDDYLDQNQYSHQNDYNSNQDGLFDEHLGRR